MSADSVELRMTIVMLSYGSNLLVCLGRLLLPTLLESASVLFATEMLTSLVDQRRPPASC